MGIYWPNVIGVLVWALCSFIYYLVECKVDGTSKPISRPDPTSDSPKANMDSAMETAMYLEYD